MMNGLNCSSEMGEDDFDEEDDLEDEDDEEISVTWIFSCLNVKS